MPELDDEDRGLGLDLVEGVKDAYTGRCSRRLSTEVDAYAVARRTGASEEEDKRERDDPHLAAPDKVTAIQLRDGAEVSFHWTSSREVLRAHRHRVADQGLCDVQRAPEHLREVGHLIEERGGSTWCVCVDDERQNDAREVRRHVLVPCPSNLGMR